MGQAVARFTGSCQCEGELNVNVNVNWTTSTWTSHHQGDVQLQAYSLALRAKFLFWLVAVGVW